MKFLYKPFIYVTLLLLITLSLLLLQERKVFDIRTLSHIDPIPHTQQLIKEEKYREADEYLSYFIDYPYVNKNPKSKELLQQIRKKRESYDYQQEKLIEGIIEGKSDEDIGKASAIASDFLFIGDIRDLSIEGSHYYNNGEVDKVIVALSSLGLIASISTIYTLGASSPAKTSISVLKYAKRANKMPSWLRKKLIAEAKIAKDSYSLSRIKTLFRPINRVYEKVGLTQTLNLLKDTKNFKDLNRIMKFSSRFGKKSQILLQVTNKQALKYSKLLPKAKTKNILYASTYGENGLKGMSKMGEAKFMRRMNFNSNLAKTTYKGNFNSLFNYLLKNVPTWLLFSIAFLGLFYFMRNFYVLARKIF
ncbi:bll5589; hypothetical protein [hydrothermal vent metagenome]|uniref:Uncharacterized protein n=1 Tax=hydrothermal vent metagenome TaxID=652676 RepID=A0A1W1CM61_9ZZZZ